LGEDQLTDTEIEAACQLHGPLAVSDAAYAAMVGRTDQLQGVGLAGPHKLGMLHHVTRIAYELMTPEQRASDLMRSTVDGANLA